MEHQELLIEAPDGRTIEVVTLGHPKGPTVVYHHGTPGSAVLAQSLEAVGERGMFVVAFSRPGYGASSRREGRSIADHVDDVRAVLDALERSSYASVGWSGGGPHALACAALDAPRCVGAWSLAGVVPVDVDFDWTEGMGPENIEEFSLALAGGPEYEAHMASAGATFADATPENIVELFGGLLSAVDVAALAPYDARFVLSEGIRRAFSHGWRGFYDDDRAFFRPWGFDPSTIAVPVSVWYGDEDLMVPSTHGDWLGRHIPTATVHHVAGEGHVSIISNHLSELVEEIAAVLVSS